MAAFDSAGSSALVGPTSASGWTGAWSESPEGQEPDMAACSSVVVVDETPSGPRLVLREGGEPVVTLDWSCRSDQPSVAVAAACLTSMFGPPDRVAEVEELLSDAGHDAESLLEGLERLLDLPQLIEPDPDAVVVVCRGEVPLIRMAAAIAGPVWLVDAGAGWTLVIPTQTGGAAHAGVAAAVSAAGRRKECTLLLRRGGPARGVGVWSRGAVDANWSWNSPWRTVDPQELATETATCVALAAAAPPGLHLPTLRALLRRRILATTSSTSSRTCSACRSPS